jgi:tRNA(Ile2) C34 agmatinyltransferase TiaS
MGVTFIASYFEYKNWNGGVCPKCGRKLEYFDTDSQGGEGWTCDECDYTTWVSYHNLVYKFWKNKLK